MPSEEYGCDYCLDTGFVKGTLETRRDGSWESKAIRCPKCQPTPESMGLPVSLKDATFTRFDVAKNAGMKDAMERCRAVAKGEAWCAVLIGSPGLGKSHLAAAALHERFGYFWEMGALLRNIRELAFGDDGPRYAEEDVIRGWQEGRFLLVLDDVGAEKMTEWAQGTLYAICNARYQSQLPTIITTNNPGAIDDRILSRYADGVMACRGSDVRRRGVSTRDEG